jgi:histidinol phosphatase-like enzyme (inositol monophosphatase family)
MTEDPDPTLFDITEHEAKVTELVRSASRLSLGWFRRPMVVENKLSTGFDPVTAADRAVEDAIRSGILRLFPDHAVLGEERGETGSGPFRWVIDPIDGTRAFISGQPMWGTLVGFQIEGRPVAGWMHIPVLDESYVATPAGGRVIGPVSTRRLVASTVTELDQAILLCTHPSMFAPGPERERFEQLESSVRMSRYSGDCLNYGLVAAGTAHLVVDNGLAPHDIVPLIPLIEASGAIVTDLEGKPPLDGGFVVVSSSPELHEKVLTILRP